MKTVSRFRELRNGFPVIVGAFMLCFIVDGITYSFGILMLELLAEFNDSRGKTALVGSVLTGAQLLGPLFGCLCERFGMLPVVMLGSLLSCAGFVGASFSTRLLQLYVLYGIVAGIGLAMLLLMANVCIIKTFKKNASLAAGIAVCGSGIGTFVISQLVGVLIDSYGWRGALLVQGGVTLQGVICGLLVGGYLSSPTNKPSNRDIKIEITNFEEGQNMTDVAENMDMDSGPKDTNEQDHDETKGVDQQKSYQHDMDSMCKVKGKDGFQINEEESERSHTHENKEYDITTGTKPEIFVIDESLNGRKMSTKGSEDLNESSNGIEANDDLHTEHQPSKSCVHMLNLDLLTNVKLLVFLASIGAVGLAFWVPFHLLPDQVNEINSSRQIATWIVSSIGIANIFGRVFFGWLGDFRRIRRIMLATGILFALGITTGSSPFLTSVETKLFYGCSFGLLIGGFFALLPVVLSDLFGADVITRTLGMAMFTIGLSASVATPIGGFIRDTTGSYTASFLVSGGEFLLAAGGFALASCLKGPAPQ